MQSDVSGASPSSSLALHIMQLVVVLPLAALCRDLSTMIEGPSQTCLMRWRGQPASSTRCILACFSSCRGLCLTAPLTISSSGSVRLSSHR